VPQWLPAWSSIIIQFVEYSNGSPQTGGALHRVLAAVAFQVFGEAMNGSEVESCVPTDGAGFLGPAHDKELQSAGFDDTVLMVRALFEL